MSDGRKAVVDKNDAKHIASNAGAKKVSQISQIKKIVETAKMVAEESSDKVNKFDYFYYYEAFVKYGKDMFPIYVNVGRARNDSSLHIYDITQKLRDTAHRVNDVGRPVGNALKNGISTNSIYKNQPFVNNNSKKDLQFSFAIVQDEKLIYKYTMAYIVFYSAQLKSAAPITYDANGEVIPLSKRFDTNKKDIRFSVPSVDSYTEEQYNSFGWVRADDVLTAAEYETLISRYADYKHNKDKYPTTRFGEAVIHSSEHPDVIMYVKGKIDSPEITKVVRINYFDTSEIKETILHNEYRQISLPYQSTESFYGEKILSINKRRDNASFRQYRAEQEGRSSQESNSFGGSEQDRAGSQKQNNATREAGLNKPAFSMPEKGNTHSESGDNSFGLSDPSDQEIYRDPTDEENAVVRTNALKIIFLDILCINKHIKNHRNSFHQVSLGSR